MDNGTTTKAERPAWMLPALIVGAIAALVLIGRKHDRAVENPLVDLTIITIGVFAIAAVMRVIGAKLNYPGFSAFFGAQQPVSTPIQ